MLYNDTMYLRQYFSVDALNHTGVTDITYIKAHEAWFNLAVVSELKCIYNYEGFQKIIKFIIV